MMGDLNEAMADETTQTQTEELDDEPRAGTSIPDAAEVADETVHELQTVIAERDEALKQKQELFDRLQRAQAEFENARRRMAKETTDARDYAAMNTVDQLLPVLDDFDRALGVDGVPEDVRKGFEMIRKRLLETFERLGLRPVEADGTFDPNIHEAVDRAPAENPEDDQKILAVLQHGYYFKDRLLRAALVRVAVAD